MSANITRYIDELGAALDSVKPEWIAEIAEMIRQAPITLVCGNGGSAAVAQHLAADLRALGYRAFDLLSSPKLTQVMNDVGAEAVFWEQVKLFPESLVIAFSCSGTSPDIQKVIGKHSNRCILVTSVMKNFPQMDKTYRVNTTDYEIAEDVFSAIAHMVKKELADEHPYQP